MVSRTINSFFRAGTNQQKPWEVIAKTPPNSRVEDIPLMLRSLLADRFHMTFHHETKEMQVYELVVAKGGSKLKEVDPPAHGLGGRRTAQGTFHMQDNSNLATLAAFLTSYLRLPTIDKTGLLGVYDIDFEYQMEGAAPADGDSWPVWLVRVSSMRWKRASA